MKKTKYIYQGAGLMRFDYDSKKEALKSETNKILEKLLFRDNYKVHQGVKIKREDMKCDKRREEWTCKITYEENKNFDIELGTLYEYQVPLKIPKKPEYSDGRGKVDLISVNLNKKNVYLIEFKVSSNKENPWKAFLEIYTYYNMLGGDKKAKEFLTKLNPEYKEYNLKPIVLIERSDDKNSVYQKMIRKKDEIKKFAVNKIKCYSCDVNHYIIKNVKEEF